MRNNIIVELFKLYTPVKSYRRDRKGRFSNKESKKIIYYGDFHK